MAIFIIILVFLLLFSITLFIYALIVAGKLNKTDEEIEYENLEQSEYIKKCKEAKKQNKKNKFKDKNDKIIYL